MTTLAPADRDGPFGLHVLAYGAVVPLADGGNGGSGDDDTPARLVVRIGEMLLDLAPVAAELAPEWAPLLAGPNLNPLLAEPRERWEQVHAAVRSWLTPEPLPDLVAEHLHPVSGWRPVLAFEVADYVDFYSSEHHAANVGAIFRPGQPALPKSWKHLPQGYHGRAGSVVVSGTPIVRPNGQRADGDEGVAVGPTRKLDIEAEVGFVVGGATRLGEPIDLPEAETHLFGVCLVNDWSARDIQAFETVPLGPFLGKSFATSVSPWVIPLPAFDRARVRPPARDPRPLPYLDDSTLPDGGLNIELEVRVNGAVVSRPPFASMYWTAAQQLAHLTVNGAPVRPGDLFASGTVSGPHDGEQGSLLELTRDGMVPLRLGDSRLLSYLDDGDEVVISGVVPASGSRPVIGLGEVRGRVIAAHGV